MTVRRHIANALLAMAVWQLPAAHRDRYRREFAVELIEIPDDQSLAYALRILARAWSLRSALLPNSAAGDPADAIPFLCRWHKHRYSLQRSPEGDGGYYECLRCAKQKDYNASIVPPTMGGGFV